jgi:hypothetical protein
MHQLSNSNVHSRSSKDEGQVSILVVLAVGTCLLLFAGFGVDMTNLFFHRQTAQNAADAACVAAGMDMLLNNTTGASMGGFTPGTGYNCTTSSTDAPCKYAALNGYTSPGLTAGTESNLVAVSFPSSVPGAVNPNSIVSGFVSTPFVQVNVTDRVRTYFSSLISSSQTQDVAAIAKCGLQLTQEPVPILILDPRNETSVTLNGAFTLDIYGGPPRSVQINSSSSSAYVPKGCSKSGFNLVNGGPATTGSNIGITGSEAATCWVPGTTSTWIAPDSPISDPFATVCAPGQSTACLTTIDGYAAPSAPTSPSWGASGDGTTVVGPNDGCPSGVTCDHYQAGVYNSGIKVKKAGGNGTAVFEPGLYYVTGGMALDSNSQVCPGTGVGDGSGGTIFYFADTNSISVAANSGSSGLACSNSAKTQITANDIKCTGSSTLPNNLPGSTVLLDNILLAPCSGYYGDPLGTKDPGGEQRGILFFQDRSANAGSTPSWGGGGQFTLGGSMYFHYCDSSTPLAGVNCNFTSGYMDNLGLQGVSGSGTYILGDIIADQLSMGGNPNINMDLNPAANYYVLKVALLQ